jgi:hypothetical protein
VYYKPTAEGSYTGDVVEFEVRDDLPPKVVAEKKP